MSTTELALEKPPQDSVVITTTPERIAELKTKFAEIKLAGVKLVDGKVVVEDASAMVADKEGLKTLKEFRMKQVVKQRTACDREFKAMKDPAWEECKRWDRWHNEFLAKIAVIEEPLVKIEEAYEAELDRLAKVAADKKWQYRLAQLFVAGAITGSINEESIRRMDEDAFVREIERVVTDKKRRDEAEAEAARLKEEQRLAAEKLAEERRLFEEQQKESARLAQAERDRLEAERQETARLAKIEQDKVAAQLAEQARINKAETDRLEKLRKEHEDLLRVQQERLESDRLAEANRVAAKELELQRKQDEFDERQRLQREHEERVEQLRLQAEADHLAREQEAAREIPVDTPPRSVVKGAWAAAMDMENIPQPEEDTSGAWLDHDDAPAMIFREPETLQSAEVNEPWHLTAARQVCDFINDRGGVAPHDQEEIEQVADIIISAFASANQ